MTPGWLDHLFVLGFAVAFPALSLRQYGDLLRRLRLGEHGLRLHAYRSTIAIQWVLAAVGLGLWVGHGRPWSALGLAAPAGPGLWASVLLAAAVITVLALQLRTVMRMSPARRAALPQRFGDVALLLPRTAQEMTAFTWLSLTAGIVEELLWRGFLIGYLAALGPTWVAVAVSSLAFGVAHSYQGRAAIAVTTAVGVGFALLYLLTGSLWVPMLLHAAVDVLRGRLGHELVRAEALAAPREDRKSAPSAWTP